MYRQSGFRSWNEGSVELPQSGSARGPRPMPSGQHNSKKTTSRFTLLSLFRAAAWSLVPGVLGFSLHFIMEGHWDWGLSLLVLSQLLIWPLVFLYRRSVRHAGEWLTILAGSGLVIGFICTAVLPWLLLPIFPAILLRYAARGGAALPIRPVMRIFSVALLAAVIALAISSELSLGLILAVTGSTMFGLVALERVITSPLKWDI